MLRNFLKRKLIYFLLFLFFLPHIILADTSYSNLITISAQVVASNPPGGGGGGGGGIPTTVNFSGMAYPLSRIFILKDGEIVATTIADQTANFSVSLLGLSTNTYTFSVYGEDSSNRKSSFFSFPVFVTSGTTVNIANIFLSPTIDVDKTQVKKGDNLIIFGQSNPKNEVVISVNSIQEHFFRVMSNTMGVYLYNLDTSILEIGQHNTKSKSILENRISSYNNPVSFSVGDKTIEKEKVDCSKLRGDLNCDGRVNLVDFSIMAYWYKKINFPTKVDLNHDGKISLIDFSIMAFNWTG